jgi:hypothetical protein
MIEENLCNLGSGKGLLDTTPKEDNEKITGAKK